MHSDYVVDLCSVNDCDLLRRGEFSKDLLSQALFSLMLHVLCNFFFLFRSTCIHTGARHNGSMTHSTISTSPCARRRVELIYIVLYSETCLPFYLSRSTCAVLCVCMCVSDACVTVAVVIRRGLKYHLGFFSPKQRTFSIPPFSN